MAQTAIHARMTAAEWALLVGLSVLWGGSFLFVGIAVAELPPLTIVVARVALAAAALLVALRFMGVALPRERRVWVAFLGMGVLNNAIPFTLIAWGQGHIASGVASIFNATTPLFTVLVAHWLTADERMTARKLAGVAIGFGGVAVMIGGAALRTLGVDVLAQLAVLAAAISYAFAGVYGRRFKAMGVPPRRPPPGADRVDPAAPAGDADRRPALDAAGAERRDGRGAPRPGAHLDRARLHPLFPAARQRRRDEPPPRHLPDPGERDPSRRNAARRAPRTAPLPRHGAHRLRPRRNRPRARRGATRSLLQGPDCHPSASRSSLPPLGEAEWRGGVGVGGGWAGSAGSGVTPHPVGFSPTRPLPAGEVGARQIPRAFPGEGLLDIKERGEQDARDRLSIFIGCQCPGVPRGDF